MSIYIYGAEDLFTSDKIFYPWRGVSIKHEYANKGYTLSPSVYFKGKAYENNYDYNFYLDLENGENIITYSIIHPTLSPIVIDKKIYLNTQSRPDIVSESNLGTKEGPFNFDFYLTDRDTTQTFTAVVKLNSTTIKTLYNIPINRQNIIPIDASLFYSLPIGSNNTISVEAINKYGLSTKKDHIFKRGDSAPSISGNDRYLGEKNRAFTVPFTVDDINREDNIRVVARLNGTTFRTIDSAPRNQTIVLDITENLLKTVQIGNISTIEIQAIDSANNSSVRRLTFTRVNNAPTISGYDQNIGIKNSSFTLSYHIDDLDAEDNLIITESLNGKIIRTIQNAPKNTPITLTVTDEQIKSLENNITNTLSIKVDDGKNGHAFRHYYFTKTNMPPQISGSDTNLGTVTNVSVKYTITDNDNDKVTVVERIDGQILKNEIIELGKEYTLTVANDVFANLGNGIHSLTVSATDSAGFSTVRTYTFTKQVTEIDLKLLSAVETDVICEKIIVNPVWENIENADVIITACNNGFDTNPTWENITQYVLNNSYYTFTNTSKTATKWGINVRFEIKRKAGTSEIIIFDGFGGAFL